MTMLKGLGIQGLDFIIAQDPQPFLRRDGRLILHVFLPSPNGL